MYADIQDFRILIVWGDTDYLSRAGSWYPSTSYCLYTSATNLLQLSKVFLPLFLPKGNLALRN